MAPSVEDELAFVSLYDKIDLVNQQLYFETETQLHHCRLPDLCWRQVFKNSLTCDGSELGNNSSIVVSSTVITSDTIESLSFQGCSLVKHSKRTKPKLQMSLERPYGLALSLSGAIYLVVPTTVVWRDWSLRDASPKSQSLTAPLEWIKTFPGLLSRCKIFSWWRRK